jgi:hypothetical protein
MLAKADTLDAISTERFESMSVVLQRQTKICCIILFSGTLMCRSSNAIPEDGCITSESRGCSGLVASVCKLAAGEALEPLEPPTPVTVLEL